MPLKFKMLQITPYIGKTYPTLQVDFFREMMMIQTLMQLHMCYPFSLTLEGHARI